MIDRAFDKIRQCAHGMPAVIIRLMDAVGAVMEQTTSPEQREVLARQAEMILRVSEASVTEENDRAAVRGRYERVMAHLGIQGGTSDSGD